MTCHGSLISIGQLTMCGTWAEAPWSVGCYSRGAGFRAGGFSTLSPPPPPPRPPVVRFVNPQPGPDLAARESMMATSLRITVLPGIQAKCMRAKQKIVEGRGLST